MRIASVDIGTNTGNLVIADVDLARNLKVIVRQERIIRLGEGVDSSGTIQPAAMDRLVSVLMEYAALAKEHGADHIAVAGTSASRDAPGGLAQAVLERTGLRYEIISGAEEAVWSFLGALSALPNVEGKIIHCDIGGGSTELTVGCDNGKIIQRCSLDVGSVRVTERFFTQQPPTSAQVARAVGFIRQCMQESGLEPSGTMVGGSDTHRILLQLSNDHVQILTASAVEDQVGRLLCMTRDEVRALEPEKLEGRDDIFPAAALICREIMGHFGYDRLTVSSRGLVHGLVLRELEKIDGPAR